jgi:hypothetical protein
MLATHMKLDPGVVSTLQIWHEMIETRDLSRLVSIVHPEAMFRSPVAFHPYAHAPALILVVKTVITVFEDFTYHRQFAGDDNLSVVLEFSARVGEKNLKGIDMIRFDAAGKIIEFEVMVRPLNALQALGAEMGARLGQHLPSFKGNV